MFEDWNNHALRTCHKGFCCFLFYVIKHTIDSWQRKREEMFVVLSQRISIIKISCLHLFSNVCYHRQYYLYVCRVWNYITIVPLYCHHVSCGFFKIVCLMWTKHTFVVKFGCVKIFMQFTSKWSQTLLNKTIKISRL